MSLKPQPTLSNELTLGIPVVHANASRMMEGGVYFFSRKCNRISPDNKKIILIIYEFSEVQRSQGWFAYHHLLAAVPDGQTRIQDGVVRLFVWRWKRLVA